MHKYKTILTDFEGMQGVLDAHAAQGWRLFSLAPDTWRKQDSNGRGMTPPPFDGLDTQPAQEYCASYYLLVFVMDEDAGRHRPPRLPAATLPSVSGAGIRELALQDGGGDRAIGEAVVGSRGVV